MLHLKAVDDVIRFRVRGSSFHNIASSRNCDGVTKLSNGTIFNNVEWRLNSQYCIKATTRLLHAFVYCYWWLRAYKRYNYCSEVCCPVDCGGDGDGRRGWSKSGSFWGGVGSTTPARFLIPRCASAPGGLQVEESASAASSPPASCSCITHSSIVCSTRESFSASRNSRTLNALLGCFSRKCLRKLHWHGSE